MFKILDTKVLKSNLIRKFLKIWRKKYYHQNKNEIISTIKAQQTGQIDGQTGIHMILVKHQNIIKLVFEIYKKKKIKFEFDKNDRVASLKILSNGFRNYQKSMK